MWKRKIKNKKLQFILIAIILILASCILSISISFRDEVSKYIDNYYARENIKDIVFTSYDKDTTLKVEKFIKEKEPKEDVTKIKSISVDRKVYLNDSNLDLEMASIFLYENKKNHPGEVVITDGEKSSYPKEGYIWVGNILADTEDLKIGDKLKVKNGDEYVDFTISSLVNDSMVPNSTMGGTFLYVGKEDYNKLNSFDKYDVIGYNFSKDKDKNEALEELTNYLGYPINGIIVDKETMLFSAKATVDIVGGVGISVAILVFIVSLIIIRFILWNNILKEFRFIGVYKALGFTSWKISLIYIKSFGMVGIVSILVGALISLFFKSYLVKISVKYLGALEGEVNNIIPLILVVLILSFIFIFNLFFMLRKLNKINPVEALRVGVTSSKAKFKKSFIKNAVSPISMAINDIFKYKKQNVIICIVLIFTMYLSVFMIGVDYSMNNMKYNSWNVFGISRGDVNIGFPESDKDYNKALSEVKKDSRVLSVIENEFATKSISIDTNKYNIKNSSVLVVLHNDYKGMNIEKGRNPESIKEVALSNSILEDSKLSIGDYIEIDILGAKKKMLITGSYKTLISGGYSIRGVSELLPDSKSVRNIVIKLKDKNEYNNFKAYYKDKYKSCSVGEMQNIIESVSESITDIVNPIVKIFLIASVAFSIINIVNILVINNNDNRRNYAIIKSIGFSNRYILKRTLWRILILSSIAIIVSLMLNTFVSSILFKFALMGIDAFMLSISRTLLTLLGIEVLIVIGTVLVMNSVKKVNITELLED